MSRALATGSLALATLGAASQAHAFCRATTCNPADPAQACQVQGSCVASGAPLAWDSGCIKVGIQEAASPRHGISFESFEQITDAAFQAWTLADCGGGIPSIHVEIVGPIACNKVEFNSSAGNVSLVTFRDEQWPYVGGVDAIGRTTLRFDTVTGQIWDADIEINGTLGPIATDGSKGTFDLQSILTHEAGHALGLGHSTVPGSTMIAGHSGQDTELRTLEADDVEGICAIYPPGRVPHSTSCEPRGGFSGECGGKIDDPPVNPDPDPDATDGGGCQTVGSKVDEPSAALLALAACFLARGRKRGRRPATLERAFVC